MTEMIFSSRFGIDPGLRIVESELMVETIEDWSRVRSPSRARRRMRYGHKQNVRNIIVPCKHAMRIGDILYIHPVAAKALRDALKAKMDRLEEGAFLTGGLDANNISASERIRSSGRNHDAS